MPGSNLLKLIIYAMEQQQREGRNRCGDYYKPGALSALYVA